MVEAIFLLAVLAALAIFGLALWLAHQRRKDLVALAARLGLTFQAHAGRPDDAQRQLVAMSERRGARIVNELSGAYKGRDVRAFEFKFEVKRDKHTHTETRSVALTRVPVAWPPLRIVPEHLGHKIADALGADDIDFEWQEFSDRYWVRAEDRRFAYDVVHGRMMEFLMTPGVSRWEIRNGWLCAWSESVWRVDEIEGVLDRLVAFVDHIPERLYEREARA